MYSVVTLPELDENDHAITQTVHRDTATHFIDIITGIIYEVDEYKLFELNTREGENRIGMLDFYTNELFLPENKLNLIHDIELFKNNLINLHLHRRF